LEVVSRKKEETKKKTNTIKYLSLNVKFEIIISLSSILSFVLTFHFPLLSFPCLSGNEKILAYNSNQNDEDSLVSRRKATFMTGAYF